MPNFWTQATQKIYEVFNGPRTTDVEFDKKVDEMKTVVNAMSKVRETIKNFPRRSQGIQATCQEVYTFFALSYGDNDIYSPLIKEVCEAHRKVEKAYTSCCEQINRLQYQTNEWDKLFAQVKENLEKRNSVREIYDHYDAKMEKIVKNRNDKQASHIGDTANEIEQFERVS